MHAKPVEPSQSQARLSKPPADRKSTRLNSSHGYISYAVFCLKKKKNKHTSDPNPSRQTFAHPRATLKTTHCHASATHLSTLVKHTTTPAPSVHTTSDLQLH